MGLAVVGSVVNPDSLAFNGDATFAFDIHAIQELRLHVALRHRSGQFEDAIGQRGLAMIDVRDNGKIADIVRIGAHRFRFF